MWNRTRDIFQDYDKGSLIYNCNLWFYGQENKQKKPPNVSYKELISKSVKTGTNAKLWH